MPQHTGSTMKQYEMDCSNTLYQTLISQRYLPHLLHLDPVQLQSVTEYTSFRKIFYYFFPLTPFFCFNLSGSERIFFSFFLLLVPVAHYHREKFGKLNKVNENKQNFSQCTLSNKFGAGPQETVFV